MHIYQGRLFTLLNTQLAIGAGGHTDWYSASASYVTVHQFRTRLSPYCNQLNVRGYYLNNGDVAARVLVRYRFGTDTHSSVSMPAIDADWNAGGWFLQGATKTLALTKIQDSDRDAGPEIVIEIQAKHSAEVLQLSIWEHRA